MSELMIGCYLSVMCAIHMGKERVNEFFSDENGVSPIIATVLILLFVVLLAIMFWDNLTELFGGLWDKIFDATDEL